jgi:hypothetical protein
MRNFKDHRGEEWTAWTVRPQVGMSLERRRGQRRGSEGGFGGEDRRTGRDRRSLLQGNIDDGWLCFQCGAEKRRLCPIPDDWESCSDARLRLYHRVASPVAPGAAAAM